MLDRDSVINDLVERIEATLAVGSEWVNMPLDLVQYALHLLKEQEAVEPDGENCGECGYTLHRINYAGPDKELRHEWLRFCPSCGKAVKWDD